MKNYIIKSLSTYWSKNNTVKNIPQQFNGEYLIDTYSKKEAEKIMKDNNLSKKGYRVKELT